ncbi:MAG: MoaD/ThiS family protein [Desulfurococcaceae archaeon]
MQQEIRVKVCYAGFLSEITGKHCEDLILPEGSTLEDLLVVLLKQSFRLKEWIDRIPLIQIRVNEKEVLNTRKHVLRDKDEITLSPPLYEGG